jgi:hypothetical protein
VKRIRRHRGLPTDRPVPRPARAPPLHAHDLALQVEAPADATLLIASVSVCIRRCVPRLKPGLSARTEIESGIIRPEDVAEDVANLRCRRRRAASDQGSSVNALSRHSVNADYLSRDARSSAHRHGLARSMYTPGLTW